MKHLTLTAALCLAASGASAEDLVIATGSTGGTYYPVGVGLAQLVSEVTELSVDAVTSGGSTENVRLIGRDEVDMAITNGVVGTLAVAGEGPFESGAQTNLRSMFALWGNTEHQVALSSAITNGTVDDLATLDGRYNIGGRQSGARTAASLMLGALGHDVEAIDTEFLSSYSEAGSALQDGRIAAANMGAGIPVAAVTELFATLGGDDVTILSFTDEQLARLDAAYPGLYYRAEIPAGTYPGQTSSVATAEYANLMVVDDDVSDDAVFAFMTAVFDDLEGVHAIHPAAGSISLDAALDGLPVPLHPGAIRFYEGRGVAIPDALRP